MMKVSERIVSMFYIKDTFSHPELTSFLLGKQYLNILNKSMKELRILCFQIIF